MPVRKAVLPAAGLGTRFLPATKAVPKEMIPVVDKPGIQYAVEEATRCGIEDILIVTAPGKEAIADHFAASERLEAQLRSVGKNDELALVRSLSELADISFVTQTEPLGFGHAVSLASEYAGDEPFVVMVPDEIVPEPLEHEVEPLARMIEVFDERKAAVIVVQEVPGEEISAYGVIEPGESWGDVVEVRRIVEKPRAHEAPSNLAARGRYIFTPDIFDALARTPGGIGSEIQLTDAIGLLAAEPQGCLAFVYAGTILDVGKKIDYLRASVELALRREDLSKPFKEYLMERARSLEP
ncbi:MAG TPA: UTP--glucose-1-phosphate uridylyltransferase [Actinomycetota bacterium]|nr:UTP--glucose-1-phosphate uridylyltransferase [Actinomycetota bacterium]